MKLLYLVAALILLLSLPCKIQAQYVFEHGSESQALGGITTTLSGSWSVIGNQAGLADLLRPSTGISFQNKFLVRELSTRSVFAVLPYRSSVFAISFAQFGKIPFRQEKIGFSYSRKLGQKLNFGAQFNYYQLFLAEENRSVGSSGLEIGIQYFFSEKVIAGIQIVNPYQDGIKLSSGTFKYPSLLKYGVLYRSTDNFFITTEAENDKLSHFILRTGIGYYALEKLCLRAGISGKPYRVSGGIGFRSRNITIDIATSYGQYLGQTPSVSCQYQF